MVCDQHRALEEEKLEQQQPSCYHRAWPVERNRAKAEKEEGVPEVPV